jgi:hypothetical protein
MYYIGKWVSGNLWIRAAVLIVFGGLIWLDGVHSAGDAQKYKKGPELVNLSTQNLNAQRQKYDYVNARGYSDGSYVYFEFTTKDKGKETGKAYTLYYALLDEKEYVRQRASETVIKTRPKLMIKQYLDDPACLKTEKGCLNTGVQEIKGLLIDGFQSKDDKESFDKLVKDSHYVVDDKTLFLDVYWKPPDADGAAFGVGLGKVIVTVGLISIPFSMSLRRRREARQLAAQKS